MGVICHKQGVYVNHIHTLREQTSFQLLFGEMYKKKLPIRFRLARRRLSDLCSRLLDICLDLGTICTDCCSYTGSNSREKRLLASCPSVYPSDGMCQPGFSWTDSCEIWYWGLPERSAQKIQNWFIYLSFRSSDSCRRLPEPKRHFFLFNHWSASKCLVVMAARTPSIHVFLGRSLFLLSPGIHHIINFGIL